MYNYLYKIYPKLFGNDYKVLYMDTDSIYAKLNMTHEEYVKILEKNKDLFGKEIGNIEPESLNNPIQEGVFLSSKCYSYICKNDIQKMNIKYSSYFVYRIKIKFSKKITLYFQRQYEYLTKYYRLNI